MKDIIPATEQSKDIQNEFIQLLGKDAFFNSLELYAVDSTVSKLVHLSQYLITQVKQLANYADNDGKEYVNDIMKGVLDILKK